MKRTTISALVIAAAMALTNGAQAQVGCYIGISGGIANWNSNTSVTSPLLANAGVGIDNLGATSKFLGGGVGCDARLDKLVVGLMADYDRFQDMQNKINVGLGGFTANTAFKLEDSWFVGGRIGYMVSQSTLAYVLGGYTTVRTGDFTLTTNIPGIVGSAPNSDLSGLTLGGGLETALGGNWSMKAEYRYTDLDAKSLPFSIGPFGKVADIGIDSNLHTVRLGISYNFGGAREPIQPLK